MWNRTVVLSSSTVAVALHRKDDDGGAAAVVHDSSHSVHPSIGKSCLHFMLRTDKRYDDSQRVALFVCSTNSLLFLFAISNIHLQRQRKSKFIHLLDCSANILQT